MNYLLNTTVYSGPCDSCLRHEYLEKVDVTWITSTKLDTSPNKRFDFLCRKCAEVRTQKKKSKGGKRKGLFASLVS